MATTNSYKATVALGSLRPSEDNPRRDFGDIGALAERIRATGGQPVNPICVVRDGDVYRIVDGERRYRAMRELCGGDDAASVEVLVFADYSEAHAAVAMLATDDKRQLSESERARGFQTMLRLDVDETAMARSLNRSVDDVRRARRVAAIAPEQATLDQMVRAADFESEDDRRAVLEAKNWAAEAEGIDRRIRRDAEMRPIAEEIARLGVRVADERPDGYEPPPTWCRSTEAVREFVEEHEGADVVAVAVGWSVGYHLYAPAEGDAPAETEAQRAARELEERRKAATETLTGALLRFVAQAEEAPQLSIACGALRPELEAWECEQLAAALEGRGVDEDSALALTASPASLHEVAKTIRHWKLGWRCLATTLLVAAADDGFASTEEDAWLMLQARKGDEGDGDGEE